MKSAAWSTLEYIMNGKSSGFSGLKLQKTVLKMIDIEHCYACGGNHYNMIVVPLQAPLDGYNYKVTCPVKLSPVYIKFHTN